MKKLCKLLFMCYVVGVSTPTFASDMDSDSARDRRIDNFLAKVPKFSGYAQLGYMWKDDNGTDISTFKVNRVRLVLDGKISKMFEYRIQAEGFSNSTDDNGKSLISIQDMFIKAKITAGLNFQIGQMPIPLSMENFDLSPGTLEPINFSSIVNRMVCRNVISGFGHYGRDIGIQAMGSFYDQGDYNLLSYNLALFNGSQLNQMDDNTTKDIVARVTVQPWKNFKFSGSVNWGQYKGTEGQGINTFGNYASLTRYVVGGYYKSEEFVLRGEFGSQSSTTANVRENMYYILAGYSFGKVMPIVRWDVYDDIKMHNGAENNYLVGAVYTPIKRLRVQANYGITHYQAAGKENGQVFEIMVTGFF